MWSHFFTCKSVICGVRNLSKRCLRCFCFLHCCGTGDVARANLKHVCECEFSKRNCLRHRVSFTAIDLVLMKQLRLPSWPRIYLHDAFSGPYGIVKTNGSDTYEVPRGGTAL